MKKQANKKDRIQIVKDSFKKMSLEEKFDLLNPQKYLLKRVLPDLLYEKHKKENANSPRYCYNCDTEIKPGEKFCKNCGSNQNVCPACHAEREGEEEFCRECGQRFI